MSATCDAVRGKTVRRLKAIPSTLDIACGQLRRPSTSMEEAPRMDPVEKAYESLEEAFNRIVCLPKAEKQTLLEGFMERAQKELQELEKPHLPEPDSGYPKYKGGDAVAFLKEHWGQYLKHFNPNIDRDYLYQDQLRKLDDNLMVALDNQVRRRHKRGELPKLAEIVPPIMIRSRTEEKSLSAEDVKASQRLVKNKSRQSKSKDSPAPA